MRQNDNRSRKIAVVPEALMNGHLSDREDALSMQRRLEEQGYGIIQLPPADAPTTVIENAVRYVVDQVQDYVKNSYEVIEVTTLRDADKASRIFREACQARQITLRSLPLGP
jgi:predicted CoA-binding protein